MAVEFQGLPRQRDIAPAALFDPLAHLNAPATSSALAEPEGSMPIQPEAPRPTPVRRRRSGRLVAASAVALAAAGWVALVLLTASPRTGAAQVVDSGASTHSSPVLEMPSPSPADTVTGSASDSASVNAAPADVSGAVAPAPAAHPRPAAVDNAARAAIGPPDAHRTQRTDQAVSPRKPPAAVTPPPSMSREEAEEWSAAFGPHGEFWNHFRPGGPWQR